MSLASKVREDNERLREALIQAKSDCETMVAQQAAADKEVKGGVDFAHLLSLVKDFGDGLGGCNEPLPTLHCHVVSMATPPSSPRAACSKRRTELEDEAANLRAELAASQREVFGLTAALAQRSDEVAEARKYKRRISA